MGSARPEIVIVEREATRVAQEAAAALRASRKKVSRLKDMHLPTWTGKSGAAGAPLARPRFGASKPALGRGADVGLQHVPQENSSSAILDGLKQGSSSIRPGQANPSEIIKDIREFLANSLNNEASSGELVSEFIDRIGPEGIPVFRKMLKEVADFQKDGESQGSWRLKSEFV